MEDSVTLCSICEAEHFGSPVADNMATILSAPKCALVGIECPCCGLTDTRVEGFTRPVRWPPA